jgi:hypothetical protein
MGSYHRRQGFGWSSQHELHGPQFAEAITNYHCGIISLRTM